MMNEDAPSAPGPWWSLFDYLDQSTWWKPRDCAPVPIHRMGTSHQRNLLRFLRRHTDRLPAAHTAEAYLTLFGPFAPRGEVATWEVEHGLDAEFEQIVADPVAWLEQTPLVTRLRELIDADDALASVGPEWWEN